MDCIDEKSISILYVILLLDIIAMFVVVVVDLSSMTVNSSKSMTTMVVMTIYFPQLGMQIKIRHDRMYHFHPPLPKILVMTNIVNSSV